MLDVLDAHISKANKKSAVECGGGQFLVQEGSEAHLLNCQECKLEHNNGGPQTSYTTPTTYCILLVIEKRVNVC